MTKGVGGIWVFWLSISAVVVWFLLRGLIREQQYRRVSQKLGFTFAGWRLPQSLDLSKASFRDSSGSATRVITGVFGGVDTTLFQFETNCGETGHAQTTVAMKSNVPVAELSSLWQASGIHAERIGEWIVMFTPQKLVPPAGVPDFLANCRDLIRFFEDVEKHVPDAH